MPSPQEELWRLFGSPLPTQTMEGSDGAMAISPAVETPSLSKTGSQVVPLLMVFQTPPEATPTKTILGLLSTTAKSSMRPPMTAGPISRNSSDLNLSIGADALTAAGFAEAAFSLSLVFVLSFCPLATAPARQNTPHSANVIETNSFNMPSSTDGLRRTQKKGSASYRAGRADAAIEFQKWEPLLGYGRNL